MIALSKLEERELKEKLSLLCEMMFGFGVKPECTIDSVTVLGDTPLHSAVIVGDVRAVELLIKAGAKVNAVGEDGYAPLHEAVIRNSMEIAKILLENGADARIETNDKQDAFALSVENEEMYRLLNSLSE